MMLDGILDEQTGEFIDDEVSRSGGCGYPRTQEKSCYNSIKDTPAEANIRKVRKELAILIKKFQSENKSQPVNNARKYINLKYGKGWRERGLVVNHPDQWKPLDQYQEPEDFKF